MSQAVSASVPGPVLSYLLYETSKKHLQYGFLLGEIILKEVTIVTDEAQNQVDVSKVIKINSIIPCPKHLFPKLWVDIERMRRFLGHNFPKVVAWYKYEPCSSFKLTLKEKALHKQFREIFNVPADLFSIFFISAKATDNFSTHTFQQIFMRYINGNFDKLPFEIPNLGEANNTYKNSEPTSEHINKIITSINVDFENTRGVVAVNEIANAVQNHIEKTVKELVEAEQIMFELQEEIFNINQNRLPKSIKIECNDELSNSRNGDSGDFNNGSVDEPNLGYKSEGRKRPVAKREIRTTRSSSLKDMNIGQDTMDVDCCELDFAKKPKGPKIKH